MVPLKNADVIPAPSHALAVKSSLVVWNDLPGSVLVRVHSIRCDGKQWEKVIRVGFNVIRQASVRLSLQLQIGAYYAFSLIDLLILQTLYPWRETHDSTQDCSTPFICRQITIFEAGTCAFWLPCLASIPHLWTGGITTEVEGQTVSKVLGSSFCCTEVIGGVATEFRVNNIRS